jgi:uncharacterized protein (TIGR02996 family)
MHIRVMYRARLMARFELGDRIWEIIQVDKTLEISDAGARTVRRFVSADKARAIYDELVADRLRTGHQQIDGCEAAQVAAPAPAAPRRSRARPVVHDAREPELERAILADPDDREAYRVYGDWLHGQGDPRGDWIALAAAADADPRDDDAKDRAEMFRRRHAKYLCGPLAGATWRLGFAQRLVVTLDERTVAAQLAHPAARFATEIAANEGHARNRAGGLAMLAQHAPQTLRAIEIKLATPLDAIDELAPLLTRLRRLSIVNDVASTGVIAIADARATVGARCIDRLRDLPRLERLEIGPLADAAALRDLLTREFPALTHLRLRAPEATELCREIVTSPLAPQLVVLELRARLVEADALVLVAHRARFSKLRELWVIEVLVSPATRAQLASVAKHLVDIRHVLAGTIRPERRYNPIAE